MEESVMIQEEPSGTIPEELQGSPLSVPEQASDAGTEPPEEEEPAPQVDYGALAEEDMKEIHRLVPSLEGISHLAELPNAIRYAALRDAGLTVEEALWAACHQVVAGRTPYDNRSHLRSAVPRGAAGNPAAMSASEMQAAKELFGDLTEAEIQRLYAKCR